MDKQRKELQTDYDGVAEEYSTQLFQELDHKPFDRALLERYVQAVRGLGTVCDIGCGPGHVARYLHGQGADVVGIDLSVRMIERARQLTPEIEFRQGNMAHLEIEDGAWGGIVAFYSLIHIAREGVMTVLQEFKRVLRTGGLLLLAFHVGQEVRHVEELWGKTVALDFVFFERAEMEHYLSAAGFVVEESSERAPYEGHEVQTQRAYILARKP